MRRDLVIVLVIFSVLPIMIDFAYAQDNEKIREIKPDIVDRDFIVEEFVGQLHLPTTFDFVDQGMLVLEKNGDVIFIKDGILQSEPVLSLDVSNSAEEGLIGILVNNGFVYLHYTTQNSNDNTTSNWFYRYEWINEKLTNPVLLKEIHGGDGMHNSGVMVKDPNGTIMMVIGDLGDSGKNRQGLLQNYSTGEPDDTSVIMPIDPPGEYYAIGIRNSYGLSFDPITKILWDTENGPDKFDEVNLVKKGFNSGWAKIQGPMKDELEFPLEDFVYSDPEFSWEKPIGVTAIHFLQSEFFNKYNESVLIGDFHQGRLWIFQLNENRDGFVFTDNRLKDLVLNIEDSKKEIIFGTGFSGITDIKEGPDGYIYIASIGSGKIFRILPNPNEQTLVDCNDTISAGKDFAGCHISNIDLSDMDLSFIDFSYTTLENIDFSNTDLSNAKFIDAKLVNVKINNVNLSNANLMEINLENSVILDSNFINSDLSNADMEKSIIKNSDFKNTFFQGVNLKDSKLTTVNLENSEFVSVDSSNSEINSSIFKNANLERTDFSNSKMKNNDFEGTTNYKVNFQNTILENIVMVNSDSYRADFSNSKIKNLDIRNSRISEIFFDNVTISNSNLSGIYPINSDFSKTNFSDDTLIDTCLNSKLTDRIINNIFRIIRDNLQINIVSAEELLLSFCT